MKVIKPATVRAWAQKYPAAQSSLFGWLALVKAARFENFVALRKVYPSADQVRVASGRNVIVFNISGNKYRLIAAMHFNTQRIFTLRFMTHAEYSKSIGDRLYEKDSQAASFCRVSQGVSRAL